MDQTYTVASYILSSRLPAKNWKDSGEKEKGYTFSDLSQKDEVNNQNISQTIEVFSCLFLTKINLNMEWTRGSLHSFRDPLKKKSNPSRFTKLKSKKSSFRLYYSWTVSVLVQFESEVEEAIRAKQESFSLTVRKWLCALAYNLIRASLRVGD